MLLAMKDEAGSILKGEENDFLLENSYKEDTLEDLTAAVMLMARIQPVDGNTETVPSYDAKPVSEKFMGTVCFGNDHFATITGYGDYVQGNLKICHVYYVEGLGHNLFSIRQFYDGDLKVAFRSNTCYVWNLEGDDLLTGSCDLNIYTISISEMTASSPVCLMFRATSTKSWLWHYRLSHLNVGKSKKASFPPKLVPSINSKLELLHMDLCEPMRVATSSPEVSDNFAANTLNDEKTSSSSSIVVEEDEAPQIVSLSAEQVATEPNSPVLNENADEFRSVLHKPPTPVFEDAESSSTYQDPSNMHKFHKKHRLSDKWTKNHPIKQVIGDPSKPVMTRNRLQTDTEVCMYALIVSTIEPKNIKEAMLDASWIESMQDELN
ncbi:integrase, catalytic region, zinc finger, CCHC-type containing protein [Tanacetum coccineum]